MISDSIMPSNEESRGYVLRKINQTSFARHGKLLGIDGRFTTLSETVIESSKDGYLN